MHLKETISYNADLPAPTIKIFEEVSGSPSSTPLKTSPSKIGSFAHSFKNSVGLNDS
jgi:hypothetical protein